MVELVRLELSRGVAVLLVSYPCGAGVSPAAKVLNQIELPTMLFNCFVADGWWRARKALEPVIRTEVRMEFAERLALAKHGQKSATLAEMEREVNRRLDGKAPSDGLY